MKLTVAVFLIIGLSYIGLVVYTGYNAYTKYEKVRIEYGMPYIQVVNVGSVNMADWISEFDRLDTRVTACKLRFDENDYHKDSMELLGESINVESLIDLYTWEMPKYQFFNSAINVKNANRLTFRLKHGLIGDTIEKGYDNGGNLVARLSLKGRVTVLWQQDAGVPCEYAIVFKKK